MKCLSYYLVGGRGGAAIKTRKQTLKMLMVLIQAPSAFKSSATVFCQLTREF